MTNFYSKYLKYKKKYLMAKSNMRGGAEESLENGKDIDLENANDIDLRHEPGAMIVQKDPDQFFEFRIAEREETIQTLEGPQVAKKGYYIMTGAHGENWPIPAQDFENTYNIKPGTYTASKKSIPVLAKQMQKNFFVKPPWSKNRLVGKPNDWLVQNKEKGPDDAWLVKEKIFNETYIIPEH